MYTVHYALEPFLLLLKAQGCTPAWGGAGCRMNWDSVPSTSTDRRASCMVPSGIGVSLNACMYVCESAHGSQSWCVMCMCMCVCVCVFASERASMCVSVCIPLHASTCGNDVITCILCSVLQKSKTHSINVCRGISKLGTWTG